LIFVLLSIEAACIFPKQYGSGWQQPELRAPDAAAILMSDIPDGSGADGVMAGSGALVTLQVSQQLLKRDYGVVKAEGHSLPDLLSEAKGKNVHFILVGHIPRWEDNATSWSAKRDYASLTLELYDADSGKLLASSQRTAEGVTHPDRCAPWLAEAAAADVFGGTVPGVESKPDC